jgi:nitrate reductase NapE component
MLLPFVLALHSAHAELAKGTPPADETNFLGTAVFIVLFVAFCGGFAWYVWRNEQRAKQKKTADAAKH